VEAIGQRESALMRRFYDGVCGIEGVTVYGDFGVKRRAPIVTLNIGDNDSAMIADTLYETYGIATRPGAHCAPRMHQALGTPEQGAVRFSFSWFNTEAEVDESINAVKELAD
jgi:selenocysteine lyase/cysteine desulfurase